MNETRLGVCCVHLPNQLSCKCRCHLTRYFARKTPISKRLELLKESSSNMDSGFISIHPKALQEMIEDSKEMEKALMLYKKWEFDETSE